MRFLRDLALGGLLLATTSVAAKEPKIKRQEFEHLPNVLFYFDDSPSILSYVGATQSIWYTNDNGQKWQEVENNKGQVIDVLEHPHDNKRAIAIGKDKVHWVTDDEGKTWREFKTPEPATIRQVPFAFSASNPDYVLFAGSPCRGGFEDLFRSDCFDTTYYTTDFFKTEPKEMLKYTRRCVFTQGTKEFNQTSESTVLCITEAEDARAMSRQLVLSDNWFKDSEEPKLDGINVVKGVAELAAVHKFIVVAVRSVGTQEMALYVTDDTKEWHRAEFPHEHGGLKENAYTILESTPYNIQIDVLTGHPLNPTGTFFTSNSNGTYFTRGLEHTNRESNGQVDFEKIEGIDGILLANVVKNYQEVESNLFASKKLVSRISFDDGKMDTWKPLKADGKELHLHSVTTDHGGGKVFSSRAPGLVMGVGNTGSELEKYVDGDLYLSDDAGMTWEKKKDGPYKYEFGGSGSVIVIARDETYTDTIHYSTNFGKDWEKHKLDVEIRVRLLTTTPDSTSLNFFIMGTDKDKKAHAINIDFGDVLDKKCEKDDFEKWYARYDEEGKPDCLMGHKQYFYRRKKDAQCNAAKLYEEPDAEEEICECQDHDFECDFNYIRSDDGKTCNPVPGTLKSPADQCKNPKDKYKGPSGFRKIPGNNCKGGVNKEEEEVERECGDVAAPPANGKIASQITKFKGERPAEYFYLDHAETSSTNEETIIMVSAAQEVWVTHDHGKKWEQPDILKDVTVVAVYPHSYDYDRVYFVTASKDLYYSHNRAKNIIKIEAPTPPNRERLPILDFHPDHPDWLIWTGQKNCDKPETCQTVAYYNLKDPQFAEWHGLKSGVRTCKWIRGEQVYSEKLIFCEHVAPSLDDPKHPALRLIASDDFFEKETVHFEDIVGFAKMAEFIVVASINATDGFLQPYSSIDGKTFAHAKFPPNFNAPRQTAYTVLDSDTHAVFLHVTVSESEGHEYGSLMKSNSNGTNFVLSLDAVNRDSIGYVDFEKMHSLEGVVLINRVQNAKNAANGENKQLRTYISHNDGGEWRLLDAPEKDSEGMDFGCNVKNPEKCSLNLHHYTERTDHVRHTFASGSAIALMFGVGNVGDSLKSFAEGSTFMTRDGGLTWKEVKKGQYLWEYGDQGSIIVIVDRKNPTDTVHYTLDEGNTWHDFKFGEELRVRDISTVPSDTSRKFLLWGEKKSEPGKFYTVHLDFSGLTDRQCKFDENDKEGDDFYLWTFEDTRGDKNRCLFGHKARYNRKELTSDCYIGRTIPKMQKEFENCECESWDFECDYNYEKNNAGECVLIKGLPKPDHSDMCMKDKGLLEYYEPTGYRRLPMTTCEGGKQWDKGEPHPCPGKEDEWKEKRKGLHGFGLFLVIVVPIAAAGAFGYFAWTRLMNGGGRFGAIRLGEDNDSPLVKYPVIALSAVVAVAMALPSILAGIGRWVSSKFTRNRRYTTRDSFSRRGGYSIINNDEGELLGASDDEDDV